MLYLEVHTDVMDVHNMKLFLIYSFFFSDVDALPEHLYVGHFNIIHLF